MKLRAPVADVLSDLERALGVPLDLLEDLEGHPGGRLLDCGGVLEAEPVVLRVTVHDQRKDMVERFTKEFAPLVPSGPPGVTGYTSGRPPVREVFAYWPALLDKKAVTPRAEGLT